MTVTRDRIRDLSPARLKLLAQRLKKKEPVLTLPRVIPAPDDRYQPFPMTDVQQAYWVGRTDLFELGGVASHAYVEIPTGAIDVDRFNRAWQRVIDRHPMMRAIIRPDGLQQVLEHVPPYEMEVLDLTGRSAEEAEAALASLRDRMSHQVLPADRWPLFEIVLSRLDDQGSRIHLSFDILIGDIWSFQLLQRDLRILYTAPDAELAPLDLTFRDYVLAQSGFEGSPTYKRSLDYWHRRLPNLPPGPELPLARNPTALGRPRFRRRRAHLERPAWQRLRRLAAQRELTPSGLLLAAYAEVLSIWSKEPRFTLNVTTFNRLPVHPQVNEVVGDFTSLTLLEVDNTRSGTFEDRARRIQQQLWRDLEHGHVSAVRLMREMGRLHAQAQGVLMPVVFTSLLFGQDSAANAPEGEAPADTAAETAESEAEQGISQTPQVWLDHQVGEDSGTLSFNWDAVEDLFPGGLLDDMFAVYQAFLRRLAEDPAAWAERSLPALPRPHLEVRERVNSTAGPVSSELLHAIFERQAAIRPQQAAVISPTLTLTYRQLDMRANRLARHLRERGAAANRLVAVVMEKGWEQVVAVLAVLKAGAAYLPIDPDLPAERRNHLMAHGEVDLALTQSWLEPRLGWPGAVARLAVDVPEDETSLAEPLKTVQDPLDLAYVIFTSGSTGLPKGVMIDHRGAVNTVLDVNRRFAVGEEDRVLALSSLSFDLSVYDIFGLLAAGGSIVLPRADAGRDPGHWAEMIAEHRVTLWNSVPALLELFVERIADRDSAVCRSLRLALLSGDWVPLSLPERFRALAPDARAISLGGATEASIWSILYPIDRVDASWVSIPYGRPMANQSFWVLSPRLEPCPIWVPGDLFIGGVGLAKGYWRDPARTAASFGTFQADGQRYYRTGDLGRYLPDGNIEFLGREDLQVKIQGYRVELGEIESALERHPQVRTAVAVALGEAGGPRRLMACVVPHGADGAASLEAPSEMRAEETGSSSAGQGLAPGRAGDRITLPPAALDGSPGREHTRPSSRHGTPLRSIPREELGRWLGCLQQLTLEEFPMPKYRYPSAANLYPVQIYLAVRAGGVDGLAGTYYYHPKNHGLIPISKRFEIDPALFLPRDRPLFENAALALFLIAETKAIRPIYGDWSTMLALLEAGYVGRLLSSTAEDSEIDLTPLEAMDFEPLREALALEASHVFLHALLVAGSGGSPPVSREAAFGSAELATEPVLKSWSPEHTPELHAELESEVDQLMFKLSEPGIRQDLGEEDAVGFEELPRDEATTDLYRRRRSHREFRPRALPLEDLGRLVGLLGAAGSPPSALRAAIEVYLTVKPGRVGGLPAGGYRYHAADHSLELIASGHPLGRELHIPANQRVFDQSAFAVFFVALVDDLVPEHGDWSWDLLTLAAGGLGQSLMEGAPSADLGLCPIGNVVFEPVRGHLGLSSRHVLLHSLLGGGIAADSGATRDPREGADPLADELRRFLEKSLPAYMVPSGLALLDELPLSANGKVDRKALGQRLALPTTAGLSHVAPRNELEELVAAVWREVLDVDRVGMNDNFFELGGNSVAVVRMHRRLQELLDVELPIGRLFSIPTPAALAAFFNQESPDGESLMKDRERARSRRAARQRRRRTPRGGPSSADPTGDGNA